MVKVYGELEFVYQNVTMDDVKRYVVTLKGYDFYLYSPSSDKNLTKNKGVDFYHMPLNYMKRYKALCPICGESMLLSGQQTICRENIKLNANYNIKKELRKKSRQCDLRSIFSSRKLNDTITDETNFFR